MYEVPENWESLIARMRFFRQIPRPLAVLLACDLAALARQDALGREAIEAAREWLFGRRSDREIRTLFHQVYIVSERPPRHREFGGRNAAACTLGVAIRQEDSALHAAIAANELACSRDSNTSFSRQRRLVSDIVAIARNDTIQSLLAAAETEPSARAVFWEAMHDAGYSPLVVQPPEIESVG